MKYLIVNADDLGYSEGVNEGIIQAYKRGIVTSTSLMVYGQAAKQGVALVRKYPKLSLGLHFQIGKDELSVLAQQFNKMLAIATVEKTKNEFIKQMELFKRLTGKMPDHIDGHYHVHKLPNVFSSIQRYAEKQNIPLRDVKVKFIGDFFGMPDESRVSSESLVGILQNLKEGISELMCHPAKYTDDLNSSYKRQREMELEALTSDEVKDIIKKLDIKLINWADDIITE